MTEEEAEEDDVVVSKTTFSPLFCYVVSSLILRTPVLFILLHAASDHSVMI